MCISTLRIVLQLLLVQHGLATSAAACAHGSQVELQQLSGEIIARGGLPEAPADGHGYLRKSYFKSSSVGTYRVCTFTIKPPAGLKSIKFIVDTEETHFVGWDSLDIYSAKGNAFGFLEGQISAHRRHSWMLIQGVDSVTLKLRSSSPDTHFSLRYEATANQKAEAHSPWRGEPEVFWVMVVVAAFVGLLLICMTGVAMWWYASAKRRQQLAINQSTVVSHAAHLSSQLRLPSSPTLRRKAKLELDTVKQLNALPMQKWEDRQDDCGEDEEDSMCVFCMEDFVADDELRVLPCGHYFHKKCIDQWFASSRFKVRSCPNCRSDPAADLACSEACRKPQDATPANEEGPALYPLEEVVIDIERGASSSNAPAISADNLPSSPSAVRATSSKGTVIGAANLPSSPSAVEA